MASPNVYRESRAFEPFEVEEPEDSSRRETTCMQTAMTVAVYSLGSMGLNLLMKYLFSHMPLQLYEGQRQVYGLPAPLFWTATQQAIGFGCFSVSFVMHRQTKGRYGYRPPPLTLSTAKMVTLLALSFSASMGLNNLSLSLVSLSVNNMIRSTSPLTTAAAAALWTGKGPTSEQWVLVGLGTLFVLINVISARPPPSTQSSFALGVAAGFLSTLGGAFMFIIVERFQSAPTALNAVDSMGFMTLPAAVLLTPGIFLFQHATGNWLEAGMRTTDFELVSMVSDGARLLAAVAFGGFAAYGYNILQFYTVQELSSTQTAFASNVSKAALVLISWMFLEEPASQLQSWLVLLSAAGGLACFLLYALSKARKLEPEETWYHNPKRKAMVLLLAVDAAILGTLACGRWLAQSQPERQLS